MLALETSVDSENPGSILNYLYFTIAKYFISMNTYI